jgi:colicin import membrane protein
MAINQKYEGDDVKGAKGAEYDAEVKAKADAKAYADAEVKAKAEAKDAGVQWTPWPKYGTKPTDAEAKARAKAEAEAKARAEEAGDDPWTAWPSPEPKAEEGGATGGTGGTGATGATGPATVQVWDASSGQMKTMVAP